MKTRMKVRGRRRAQLDESQLALAYLLLAKQLLGEEKKPDEGRAK